MTGPEHYPEAERLIADAANADPAAANDDVRLLVDFARAHAALAFVAATAELDAVEDSEGRAVTGRTDVQDAAWAEVLS